MLELFFIRFCFTEKQEICRESCTNQSEPNLLAGGSLGYQLFFRTYPIKDGDTLQITWKEEVSPSRLQEIRQRDGEAKKTL